MQNPENGTRGNGFSRREVLKLGSAAAILPFFGQFASLAQTAVSAGKQGEWRSYASDKASTKYSPLDQVTAENFSNLKVA